MLTRRFFMHLMLTSGIGLLLGQPVQAQSGRDAAAEMARQSTGGRVLSVKPSDDPNRPGYLVKVLLGDGKVRTVHVNPP
jgi:uncharacterized membrane protein YkoI